MNLISPSSTPNNTCFTKPKISSKSNTRKLDKTKLLSKSLCLHRDQQVQKDLLPIIIIQEHKPVIQHTKLVKTRTLPHLKQTDADCIPKPENSIVLVSSTPASIHMKKKLHGPDIKIRLRKLIHKERPSNPMDQVTIQLSLCEDLKPSSESSQAISSNILHPPILSSKRSSVSSKTKKRSISPVITRSTSICEIKEVNEDPYYFLNILKYINFSSFYLLLEGVIDSNCNNFPYYSRVFKTNLKIKSAQKNMIDRAPKVYSECKCLKKEETKVAIDSKIKSLPNLSKIRKILPNLMCDFFTPQPVQYPKHLIILNFEGAIGSYVRDLCIKPGILNIIKKYSAFFQIILVLQTNPYKTSEILKLFEELGIQLSGVYFRRDLITSKELSKIQDYSEIYRNFEINDPEKEALVIAQHKYIDDCGSDYEKLVSMQVGISVKLNVDRAPVGCEEYPGCPCTILLPNFHLKQNTQLLSKLSRLATFFKEMKIPEENLDFQNVIDQGSFQTVSSTAIFQVVFDHCYQNPGGIHKTLRQNRQRSRKTGIYCYLHDKFSIPSSRVLLRSRFVIN